MQCFMADDHCETGESNYCPRSFRKMPHRRAADTEPWTEYCSELYNYKANEDPSVLNCTQTDTEDDHPILRKEVEAAVQSLKKGKTAGVDNIPAELVQAGGEDVNNVLTTICKKDLADRRIANPMDPVLSPHTSQEGQPAAVPELPNNKPHQSPKQGPAEDHTKQIEATSREDHCQRTGRFQSRKEYHRTDL